MKKIGILGNGEVGQAIASLYENTLHNVHIFDKNTKIEENIDILNVCTPYDNDFLDYVYKAINASSAHLTIIHSTTLPGTTTRLQSLVRDKFVVHSPVRGNHPSLTTSLYTFVKYIGSDTEEGYQLALNHFTSLKIEAKRFKNSFSTELAKLLCTSYYGLCIAWHDHAKQLCEKHSLEFDEVMTEWNKSYNLGYYRMGMDNVTRPVLYPPNGKIGGHCVLPNAELLSYITDNALVEEILKF